MKLRRTLIRVEKVFPDYIEIFIVGNKTLRNARISMNIFPQEIRGNIKPLDRFFAHTNLEAKNADEVILRDIAFALDPNPDDGLA